MALDPQLESYLATLDKALGPIPVSARSDIIAEIKSHVMEAQERDPNAKLGSILKALGEPESVANRYLLERGLKPGKPARTPIIKWMTIGFLGTLGLICFTLLALVWRFTPLIQVDEKKNHVSILGGLIDVNEKGGSAKIGNFSIDSDASHTAAGAKELPPGTVKIRVPFVNGQINLKTAADNQVHWTCKSYGGKESLSATKMEASVFTFDFGTASAVKCDIDVPKNIPAAIDGSNGKVNIQKILGDVEIRLKNGQVGLAPSPEAKYRYDLQVHNGHVSDFESSDDPKAFHIDMQIDNGSITEDED